MGGVRREQGKGWGGEEGRGGEGTYIPQLLGHWKNLCHTRHQRGGRESCTAHTPSPPNVVVVVVVIC